MGGITRESQEKIMPHVLRLKFGDEIGTEACKVFQVIDRNDDAIRCVLAALENADTDERRLKIIDAIWHRYYEKVAFFAVGIS